jgi:hypothetical protein
LKIEDSARLEVKNKGETFNIGDGNLMHSRVMRFEMKRKYSLVALAQETSSSIGASAMVMVRTFFWPPRQGLGKLSDGSLRLWSIIEAVLVLEIR